jgi:hypothetical protein
MDRTNQLMDEYTLAAFIAGTLPPDQRHEVIKYLTENPDARELLRMAHEALEASRQTDEFDEVAHTKVDRSLHRPPRRQDRRPIAAARRMQGLSRYVVATVVVFAIGLGLRLAFGPPTDALRSPIPADAPQLSVRVNASDLSFQWNRIPDTYHYRLVFWDPQEARVVAQHETLVNRLEGRDEFVNDLRERLVAGQMYSLRIDAVDAQNRLIQSSETVQFRAR